MNKKDFLLPVVEKEVRGETTCKACGHPFEFWKKKSWGNWAPKLCVDCKKANKFLAIFSKRID
jgi:hypothetical protein